MKTPNLLPELPVVIVNFADLFEEFCGYTDQELYAELRNPDAAPIFLTVSTVEA